MKVYILSASETEKKIINLCFRLALRTICTSVPSIFFLDDSLAFIEKIKYKNLIDLLKNTYSIIYIVSGNTGLQKHGDISFKLIKNKNRFSGFICKK